LAQEGRFRLHKGDESVVYHDPCDLGRGTGEYKVPRALLKETATLTEAEFKGNESLCCGGALGNLSLDYPTREKITNHALDILLASKPDALITACPLCKKTFAKSADCRVMDVAEWVSENIKARLWPSRQSPSKI
jgi:Fe-S oxidoreductase